MNCERRQKNLPAFQEGGLDPAKAAEMHAHLAGCRVCQKEEQALSASWNILGKLESIEPSSHFRERLWERIRKEREKEKGGLVFPRYAFSLVGIWVMGVGIGYFFYLRTTDPGNKEVSSSPAPLIRLNDPTSVENVYLSRWRGAS